VLDAYFAQVAQEAAAVPEVHGDQVDLLKRSRCYQSSPAMSCSTCHDVHTRERNADDYSDRCLGCHKVDHCPLSQTLGDSIRTGCVRCHMPVQTSNAIVSDTAGKMIRAKLRTHWIRIYR
jgi:hypothetical protein